MDGQIEPQGHGQDRSDVIRPYTLGIYNMCHGDIHTHVMYLLVHLIRPYTTACVVCVEEWIFVTSVSFTMCSFLSKMKKAKKRCFREPSNIMKSTRILPHTWYSNIYPILANIHICTLCYNGTNMCSISPCKII